MSAETNIKEFSTKFSKSSVVSVLTFKSLIHVELVFVRGVKGLYLPPLHIFGSFYQTSLDWFQVLCLSL